MPLEMQQQQEEERQERQLFRVGDRVRNISGRATGTAVPAILNMEGVVRVYTSSFIIGVDFHVHTLGVGGGTSHRLGGVIATPTGWWCQASDLELVTPVTADTPPTARTAAIAPTAAIAAAPQRPRLRVTVRRREHPGYGEQPFEVLIANGPASGITGNDIQAQLEGAYKRLLNVREWRSANRNGINYIASQLIGRGCPPEIIAAASERAASIKLAAEGMTGVSAESLDYDAIAARIGEQPPLMMIGNQLFKLYPQGNLSGARALKTIRATYTVRAKQQMEAIVAAAKIEAQMERSRADRMVADAERKVADMARAGRLVLPAWVIEAGVAVKATPRARMPWAIQVWISNKIETITFTLGAPYVRGRVITPPPVILEWIALPMGERSWTCCWLPCDLAAGTYDYKRMYVAQDNETAGGRATTSRIVSFPHISHDDTCMDLADMPARLASMDDLDRIIRRMCQGNTLINLNSLLTRMTQWPDAVRKQLPREVVRYLAGEIEVDSDQGAAFVDCTRRTVIQESAETFTVEQLERLAATTAIAAAIDAAARGDDADAAGDPVAVAAIEGPEPVFLPADPDEILTEADEDDGDAAGDDEDDEVEDAEVEEER